MISHTTKFAALIAVSLTGGTLLTFAQAASPLVFDTTAPVNDLQGSLAAQIRFAQSQIIPAHPREGDRQPYLIGRRQSLLLVRPLKPDDATPLSVIARDAGGKTLGSVKLDPPGKLPKTAYHLDDMPEGALDFAPKAGTTAAIYNGADLGKLTKPDSAVLSDLLPRNGLVTIELADGQWVADVHLPKGTGLEGKVVRVISSAGYGSTVHYSGRQVSISRGQTFQFKFVGSQWIREGELENNRIVYAEHTWSGVLPAQWIAPGLSLQVRQGNLAGDLAGLKVGAPTQLLIHTIDLGMLTPPRDRFEFAKDPTAHREYFQTLPASRLIISQYAPLALKEVMLPDGTLLTDVDPSKGGWHEGTMRQHIGKELISLGIDNANYGINSTAGKGEDSPYLAAQLAAHNSSGKYSNGVQVHGGSGGGGIVTLDNTLGNEFSHEVGHNYGLGHYVDGFKGSVHRSAGNINSTWGWDADKSRFLPNFYPTGGGKDTCLEGECQAPFDGRSFGMDPMAGGSPHSAFNRFTLYTPNSAAIIQRFLESKVVFDAASPTGFSKWNETTSAMEPYRHKLDLTRKADAPVSDLVEAKMTNLLAKNDVVKVSLGDGNWTANIQIPPASSENKGRAVSISHQAGYASTLSINGGQIPVSRGFKKDYVSDGKQWKEGAVPERAIERKPQAFGIPVVTLVGYYDPDGQLKSYIYPALHGALGFCYSGDGSALKSEDCELQVETRSGLLRFRLNDQRINPGCMNKFHINVPEASQPRSVAVVSRGRVLDKKPVTPVSEKLTFTINGAR